MEILVPTLWWRFSKKNCGGDSQKKLWWRFSKKPMVEILKKNLWWRFSKLFLFPLGSLLYPPSSGLQIPGAPIFIHLLSRQHLNVQNFQASSKNARKSIRRCAGITCKTCKIYSTVETVETVENVETVESVETVETAETVLTEDLKKSN